MAHMPSSQEKKSSDRLGHKIHVGGWVRRLIWVAFPFTATAYGRAHNGDVRQRLRHSPPAAVSASESTPFSSSSGPDAASASGVDCGICSSRITAGTGTATRNAAPYDDSESTNRQQHAASSSFGRRTRSNETNRRSTYSLGTEDTETHESIPSPHAPEAYVNLSNVMPLRGTLWVRKDASVKSLGQGSTAAKRLPYLQHVHNATEGPLSSVMGWHARPPRNLTGRMLSAVARRTQHPIGSLRGAVMQQAIGQGAGVASLHQRAAILQPQSLRQRALPLLAGRSDMSGDIVQPAGYAGLDMYRYNKLDWLSGLQNIGLF